MLFKPGLPFPARHCLSWAFLGLFMIACGPVFGHASLIAALPADGASSVYPPDEIILQYDEEVRPLSIKVLNSEGQDLAAGKEPLLMGDMIHMPVPKLGSGTYVVSYRVVSADSHPVSGSIVFAVGDAIVKPVLQTAPPPSNWGVVSVANRALMLLALTLSIGSVMYLLVMRAQGGHINRAFRRLILCAGAVALVSSIAAVGIQGASLEDLGFASLVEPKVWIDGFNSTRGMACAAICAGLVIAGMGLLRLPSALSQGAMGVGAVFCIASFALSGHGVSTLPHWLALPAWTLHAAIAIFWMGSLIPLFLAARLGQTVAFSSLKSFSSIAMITVPLLVCAGVVMAGLQVLAPAALVGTTYGLLLCTKLLFVLGLLGLAALNRFYLLHRLEGDARALASFRRSIAAELVLGFFILLLTAALSQAVPPRSLGHEVSAQIHQTLRATAGGYTAKMDFADGPAKEKTLMVTLTHFGQPFDPISVGLEMKQAKAGVEPIIRSMSSEGSGVYRYHGTDFALAGDWTMLVTALVTDFEKVTFEGTVHVH